MRVAIGQFRRATDELLNFARQLGCSGVVLNRADLPGEHRWEFMDLLQLRTKVESFGLKVESLENVPLNFYLDAMLGLPGRDEQIENYQATIRNVGRAGIPVLGFHWMPNQVWRTSRSKPGRGGATVTSFDMELVRNAPLTHDREYTADELWANWEYFMRAILPVAEESGVVLAHHPDDPPVDALGGVARIFGSFDSYKRATDLFPSKHYGLNFCMGSWSEQGPSVIEPMRYFAERGRIVYVHFRDVRGAVPNFDECFLGEGNTDVVEAVLTLKRANFQGFLIDDHVPHLVDDTDWGHRGRAHQTGYIQGLVAAVNKLG
jgi:mannonate dehydratase